MNLTTSIGGELELLYFRTVPVSRCLKVELSLYEPMDTLAIDHKFAVCQIQAYRSLKKSAALLRSHIDERVYSMMVIPPM